MSVASDYPMHSLSSEDFAAYLDVELETLSDESSPDASPDQYNNNDDDVGFERTIKALAYEITVHYKYTNSESFCSPRLLGNACKQDIMKSSPFFPFNEWLVFEYRMKRCKLEQLENKEGGQVPTSYGNFEEDNGDVCRDANEGLMSSSWLHKDICIRCGKIVDDNSGIAFRYIHKDLRLASDEIIRLRNADVKNLLNNKKLILVLDLDHTLLNSTRMEDMTSAEEYLKSEAQTLFRESSSMFERYIYTMGERSYALEMANLLDPGGVYFHSRVISQADCTQRHQKGLAVVLGLESAALILDDTEGSLSKLKSDESESEGALAVVLGVLKRIHSMFFDPVLKTVQKEVLRDCRIVFSRVFPVNSQPVNHRLWRVAEQLGAACSAEVHDSTTHVVTMDVGTDESCWAVKEKKFLVHPRWTEASFYLWQKQPEDSFPVSQVVKQ
ncbi:hypothetical protein Ancab_026731 [Ancistrocladus abbreviatus]